VEPRKFASRRGAANFLQRFPLRDLDGLGMRSAIPVMPLAGEGSEGQKRRNRIRGYRTRRLVGKPRLDPKCEHHLEVAQIRGQKGRPLDQRNRGNLQGTSPSYQIRCTP